jgi:3,4-dihydroxy 2-butanone 4-phosphate synthase/GTP cyclohydrolase II
VVKGPIERVLAAIDDYRQGKMVILVDDEDRENEGDLCLAAERVTPEAIAFMATHGRGLICLALDSEQIARLNLPMMVQANRSPLGTAFTVSIEARHGVTTGISAADRATTIRVASADDARPEDLVSPGHVFPLRARRGGVLVRTGQTEGSTDLARLAGFKPRAVICEIMREDGEMARMPDLEQFSARHGIRIASIADIITYRLQHERIVERRASAEVRPGVLGPGPAFAAHLYGAAVEETEYFALVRGDVAAASAAGQAVLVRVQSMCPIGDPFAIRPDLPDALAAIDRAGLGVFLYVCAKDRTSLRGSFEKQLVRTPPTAARAPFSSARSDTLRDFGLGAQVLADLGCRRIRLMSNSDRRIVGLESFGIEVVERIRIPPRARGDEAPRLRPIAGGKQDHEEGKI